MQAIPDVLMEGGFDWLDRFGGGLSDTERAVTRRLLEKVRDMAKAEATVDPPSDDASSGQRNPIGDQFSGFVQIDAKSAREIGDDVVDTQQKRGSATVYYAAGLGVMFLLFSVTTAGGALLEEERRGTLQRMLAADIRMSTILLGNWLFFASLGFIQVAMMFVWGAIIFGIDLWTTNHLVGFLLMTVATASAAAAFGLILATVCRTPAQLNGFGTIIVLIMSALGGSMVPRFVMPSFLDTTSKFTFNGWALDGYLKVFWYDDPTHTVGQTALRLLPELAVLLGTTLLFMAIARLLARRWEII
jgi:ABC-2 type transport system permease protein